MHRCSKQMCEQARPGISSSEGQGCFHFEKGTSIGKFERQWETFEGAPRPRPGATWPLWPACYSKHVWTMCDTWFINQTTRILVSGIIYWLTVFTDCSRESLWAYACISSIPVILTPSIIQARLIQITIAHICPQEERNCQIWSIIHANGESREIFLLLSGLRGTSRY